MKHAPEAMTARLWTFWHEGMVRITVRPGKTVTLYRGERTDEGYSRRWETYELFDGILTMRAETDSRDCDGQYSTSATYFAHVSRLQVDRNEYTGLLMPDWKKQESSVRDYAAEAAGY